jgi:hypothetical protein
MYLLLRELGASPSAWRQPEGSMISVSSVAISVPFVFTDVDLIQEQG